MEALHLNSATVTTLAADRPGLHAWRLPALGMLVLGTLAAAPGAQAYGVTFTDFGNSTDQAMIQVNPHTNPDAGFVGNVLRLTADQQGQAGSAFYRPQLFINATTDFTTTFKFRISSSQDAGGPGLSDGLAFVVQGDGPGMLGGGGGDLGYMHGSNPSSYFYAIEFDTHQNNGDLSDNEVAVTRTRAGAGGPVTEVVKAEDLDHKIHGHKLDNGHEWTARIEYNFNGLERQLEVFLGEDDDVPQRVLSQRLADDLFHFGGDSTSIGFTAATGIGYANHDVLTWSFGVPEPGSASLVGLAGLGLLLTQRRQTGPGR
jgi:hypothetical protein